MRNSVPHPGHLVKIGQIILAPVHWTGILMHRLFPEQHEKSLTSKRAAVLQGILDAGGGVFAAFVLPIFCLVAAWRVSETIYEFRHFAERWTWNTFLHGMLLRMETLFKIGFLRTLGLLTAIVTGCAVFLLPLRHSPERNGLLVWTAFTFAVSCLLVYGDSLIYSAPVIALVFGILKACMAALHHEQLSDEEQNCPSDGSDSHPAEPTVMAQGAE